MNSVRTNSKISYPDKKVKNYFIKYSDINLKRETLLKETGFNDELSSPFLQKDIDEVLESGSELCEIEGGYRIINSIELRKNNYSLLLDGVFFNVQKIIFHQIKNSDYIAAFVCTAGSKITDKSKELMKNGDMLKGYLYDIMGSLIVESSMDLIHEYLRQDMASEGLNITNRFSPGYCNWKVDEQKQLFSLLPENFCGINLTDSCLMRPTKSDSGIIGIGKAVKYNDYTCRICDDLNCIYRNLKYKKT